MRFLLCAVILILLCGCSVHSVSSSTANFPAGTGFSRHEIVVDGKPQVVWVFVPKTYDPEKVYPAIVFLHGLFEAGNVGDRCLSGGLGPVIARNRDNWPFITIFPQSNGTWRGEARDHLVIASLDYAQANYSIDPNRVILAGLSYGALGTWQIGAKHADRFAALVPVSGHRATELIERLVLLPVWAFDYREDPIVNASSSEEMCAELKSHGGVAKLTEFVGVGHDCWDKAVKDSALVPWMLAQKRTPRQVEMANVE